MPVREFELSDGQKVNVVKSKRSKNLRISIGSNGKVRVSIPSWMPYKQGYSFAKQKQDWIAQNNHSVTAILSDGQIGKSHRLHFVNYEGTTPKSRVSDIDIIIKVPAQLSTDYPSVQEIAQKACIRALKKEATTLLPQRLRQLAERYGFKYRSVTIKHLKGRWGSCSSSKEITLNCLLMQLPWQEIDYVIMHELVHTTNMSHSKEFWSELESLVKNMKDVKRQIKTRRPILQTN